MEIAVNTTLTVPETFNATVFNNAMFQRLIDGFIARGKHDARNAADIMDNFPEAGICVRCIKWHYMDKEEKSIPYEERWLAFEPDEELNESDYVIDKGEVTFNNGTVHEAYVVTHAMVVQALPVYRSLVDAMKLDCYGAGADDPDTWDAVVYDAIIQICLFGEVMLG